MKKHTRRGFTVVELVVVIAIIAVLAAVLIPTFTSIIKKANDSAALQERTNQRLEDIAQKVDNANWLSWEDFEGKLAEELAKINKDTVTSDDIKAAVTEAMKQYEASQGTSDTALTKEQVEAIVEKALEGQLTSAQVEAIVRQAIVNSGNTGVSEAQVRQIVNSAVAGIKQTGVTKAEMQKAITDALKGVNALNTSDVEKIVSEALKGFSTLTEEQVATIVEEVVKNHTPAENTVYIAGDATLSNPSVTYVLRTMNTLGTVTLTVPDDVTVKAIIIDAPNVQTVDIVYADGTGAKNAVESIEILSTASTSTHIDVNALNVIINKGRVVVEEGNTVTTLTAAPSKNSNVVVKVEQTAVVTNLNAQYQDNGTGTNDTIDIINDGTISNPQLTASATLESSGTTTTNVKVTSSADASTGDVTVAESDSAKLEGAFITETKGDTTTTSQASGKTVTPVTGEARIGTTVYATAKEAFVAANAGDTVVLLKDVTMGKWDSNNNVAVSVTESMTIDGSGYTITTSASRGIWIDANNVNLTVKNLKLDVKGTESYPRGIQVNVGIKGAKLTIENSEVHAGHYAINICNEVGVDLNITDSKLYGWGAVNLWSENYNVYVNNCELYGLNDKGYNADGWNDFGTVILEGDTTGQTTMASSSITVLIENTKISATTIGQGNHQWAILFNDQSAYNAVTVSNCTFVTEDTDGNDAYVVANDMFGQNTLEVTSSTLNGASYSYKTPDVD